MNVRIHSLSIGMLALWLCVLACGCSSSKGDAEKAAPAETPATEVISLRKGKLSTELQLPGELIAFQQVDMYAKVSSFVKKMYVDVGSEVKEGQLLVSLEAPEMNSQLAATQSRIKSQEALYIASKATYDRLLETSKTPGTISQNDLDQARARMTSDQAQWEAAQATWREFTAVQGYLEIRAPFSGVISSRNVNLGAYVGPSGKGSELPLFTLQEQKRLRLVVAVPEAYSNFLNQNDEIRFTVKAFQDQSFKAQVKRLAGALDNRLRAQRIEMDVANDNKSLLPGMIAEVFIPLSAKDSTFVVPKSSVLNTGTGTYVIRVADTKVTWIKIQRGRETDKQVEIFGAGLSEGDQLVRAASEEIRDESTIDKTKPAKE
jgi:membrane fusion protein, multidrug efflux system